MTVMVNSPGRAAEKCWEILQEHPNTTRVLDSCKNNQLSLLIWEKLLTLSKSNENSKINYLNKGKSNFKNNKSLYTKVYKSNKKNSKKCFNNSNNR
uniref:Uncharacterized protein n=1 Tax=Magallana gigas TaxID=29159 RepID=K1QG56_MAGGI